MNIIHDINIIDLAKNGNRKMLKQIIIPTVYLKTNVDLVLYFFCKLNDLVLDNTFMQFGHEFILKKISNKGHNSIIFQGTLLHRSGQYFIMK